MNDCYHVYRWSQFHKGYRCESCGRAMSDNWPRDYAFEKHNQQTYRPSQQLLGNILAALGLLVFLSLMLSAADAL